VELGPVEYIVISFPGNQFNGDVAPALEELVKDGTVRVIDLVFIHKDPDGKVVNYQYDEKAETAGFAIVDSAFDGFISDEDIEFAAAQLPPNSSAALLIWEDVWATRFAKAVLASGGEVLAGARIPRDDVQATLARLSSD
jgi:uncharacterized membrane protein